MYYLDSQRTITRRDSSLVLSGLTARSEIENLYSAHDQSSIHLICESEVFYQQRKDSCVRKEIITLMFESMLDSIVKSWEVVDQRRIEAPSTDIYKAIDDMKGSKKKKSIVKTLKAKKSHSKIGIDESVQNEYLTKLCWWKPRDEKVIIKFYNGNLYEGNISMKCMHGEGRYQWSDGTIFLGSFKGDEINGKGLIQWKDDTWYEGEFVGNLRHGKGLYVDSRKQRSYYGGWHLGTKHGEGTIYYNGTFKNSYDGEWILNVRHGFGSREYDEWSGYKGEWDSYNREGKGLMIWPNHDFYRGEWKNGVMSGYGTYIWDTYYNNTMSCPSLCAYRGFWQRGKRNEFGVLNLGFGFGSFYRGEFINDSKHGSGKFVTNNGLILQHKHLFTNDNLSPFEVTDNDGSKIVDPFIFDICDTSVGLIYHIEQIIKNIDRQSEMRAKIISEFVEYNKPHNMSCVFKKETQEDSSGFNFESLVNFEVNSLSKSLRCYESSLKTIYYQYATICNKQEVYFTPILIRLYLWQLYYDCNIHDKGVTLVEIDDILYKNQEWLSKNPHNPFDKIYFWQFQHSLISVASKLYAKGHLPGEKPDNMLANAFRTFMEKDIFPGVGRRRGKLVHNYGNFVPLKSLYTLYRSLGEPCTVRTFLCCSRPQSHTSHPPELLTEDKPVLGRNAYTLDDDLSFISDSPVKYNAVKSLSLFELFNISNLPLRRIITIFSQIFPQIYDTGHLMDLNIDVTFFEFFQVFTTCIEESLRMGYL